LNLYLVPPQKLVEPIQVQITGSKSESNRLLILQKLFPSIQLENCSQSDDSNVLQKALKQHQGTIDIHHAGTAMRFLTAYFAFSKGSEVILTGSDRMKQRPISILVEALQQLGAQVSYQSKVGYPPLKIKGVIPNNIRVSIDGSVSSQYISALLLVAPSLPNGLTVELKGKVTSLPYLQMTINLLRRIGVKVDIIKNSIQVHPSTISRSQKLTVESDWSSASYYFSYVALSENLQVTLSNYIKNSIQGDAAITEIYKVFGVKSNFLDEEKQIFLEKESKEFPKQVELDLVNTPDIAQTIAVTCLGLKISCHLYGLHTLKIKETDRLMALKIELEKFGATVHIDDSSLTMNPPEKLTENVSVDTYNDHRMAMAFAPLALKVPLAIRDADVVSKSYPTFWEDILKVGILVSKK